MQHNTAEPARVRRALGEKELRRIRNGPQPRAGHLEHAELADRAESIFHRTHDAMRVMLLPFEVQDGVDDVLERLWARRGCRPS